MDLGLSGVNPDTVFFLAATAVVSASSSFAVFALCLAWFRREQRRARSQFLKALHPGGHDNSEIFLTGREASGCGELVAQFRVNDGRQVVSVLESDGRRFVHVDGDLTAPQRARMIRYLKSEGFMS